MKIILKVIGGVIGFLLIGWYIGTMTLGIPL